MAEPESRDPARNQDQCQIVSLRNWISVLPDCCPLERFGSLCVWVMSEVTAGLGCWALGESWVKEGALSPTKAGEGEGQAGDSTWPESEPSAWWEGHRSPFCAGRRVKVAGVGDRVSRRGTKRAEKRPKRVPWVGQF